VKQIFFEFFSNFTKNGKDFLNFSKKIFSKNGPRLINRALTTILGRRSRFGKHLVVKRFLRCSQEHPHEGATTGKPSEKYETANFTYFPNFHKNFKKIGNSINIVVNISWYRRFPVKQMTFELQGLK
jgi:hypothetical protein